RSTWSKALQHKVRLAPGMPCQTLKGMTDTFAAVNPNTTESRPVAKNVTFEYLLNETSQTRARLPMRVNIFPHDGTESIIATVKNFYGLYDGNGVSFEDKDGNTLIARYENFADRQIVHVRV